MTKIGVIGSGQVGQVLAQGFRKHGHDVRIGSRTPSKLSTFTTSSGICISGFLRNQWTHAFKLLSR